MKPTFQHIPAADEEDDPKYCLCIIYHLLLYLGWVVICAINGFDLLKIKKINKSGMGKFSVFLWWAPYGYFFQSVYDSYYINQMAMKEKIVK
jgi:type IV secretory pathway TraG/TraD family ATPase VirD4